MGKMKLESLTLRNFKGTKEFTLLAGCRDTTILGDNACGKTTIADAESWLLTDKDSLGQAQFEIFPIGAIGTEHKPLEAMVEGVFVNGDTVKLKKSYRELWTKKRGEPKKEKTGNTTDYWIDDVPCKKGEYQEKVAAITAGSNQFNLLTNPHYFAGLPWTEKRKMIIDMAGDITDADVIASMPELSKLPEILGSKSCEDYKKIVAGRRKEINEKLAGIPGRIDEQDRSKPVLEKTNGLFFVEKLTKLRDKLTAKNNEIAAIKNGGVLVALKNDLADVNAEIQKITSEYQATSNALLQAQKDFLSGFKDQSADKKREVRELATKKGHLEADLENLKDVNRNLAGQWNEKSVVQFTADVCPTCGKPMTEAEEAEARAKFNQAKAENLERIQVTANANKEKAATLKEQIASVDKEIDVATESVSDLEAKIAEIENQIAASKAEISIDKSPEYIKAQDSKVKVSKKIEAYQQEAHNNAEQATAERDAIQAEITEAEKNLSLIEQVQKADNRIAELMEEEKRLAKAYETLEGELYLIDLFTRTKVSMLDDKINSKFDLVQFRMFRDQVNGGLQEVCDITVNNVPYGSLNTGARVAAGLDIIRTFSNHYNFHPVIFVDGCESVTRLPEMDTQVIRLVVSESDKNLRVVQ